MTGKLRELLIFGGALRSFKASEMVKIHCNRNETAKRPVQSNLPITSYQIQGSKHAIGLGNMYEKLKFPTKWLVLLDWWLKLLAKHRKI
ncbi:hypothetical protein RDI58_020356 [Solanum bulbocastanum]|uniref:Uncharacterized protein n=1 Tax=Solanum bulbocastanum TaxID=147425 RepID=A0AAN8Y7G9_SOLBU